MTTEPLATAKAHLSELVDRAYRQHERVTITRNGRPVAVLLGEGDYESLLETLELLGDPDARARVAEADQAIAEGNLTSRDEMAAIVAARTARGE